MLIISSMGLGCGKKLDPIPKARLAPRSCQIQWRELRVLDVTLPTADVEGNPLGGLESVRVYYLPLGVARPTVADIVAKGDIILEQRRPNLPEPGKTFALSLQDVGRSAGWMVVVATRVGGVVGQPSDCLPWLDPAYRPSMIKP